MRIRGNGKKELCYEVCTHVCVCVCVCACVCACVCVCVFIHSSAVTTASSTLSADGCTSGSGNTVNMDMTVDRPPSRVRWSIRLQQ